MALVTIERNLCVLKTISKTDGFRQSTDIKIMVDTNIAWPDSMRVAMLYLMTKAILTAETYDQFKHEFEDASINKSSGGFPLVGLVSAYANEMDKHGDKWKIINFLSAGPKPVIGQPPFSSCPRCGVPVWDHSERKLLQSGDFEDKAVWLKRAKQLYTLNPVPQYCLNCGQRFKQYSGPDGSPELAYNAYTSYQDRVDELKALIATQPTLEEVS